MKFQIQLSLYAVTGALLVSCQSLKPSPRQPGADDIAPSSWSSPAGASAPASWIADLGSPRLEALIAEAEEKNFGLEAAYQRTRAAAAAARISKSLRIPSLSASMRSSKSQSLSSYAPPVSFESESHSLGLSARWEIDLWNRLGQEANAAKAQYQASQYDFEAFRLSLAGQIAKTWFSAIEAKQQYELANASAESFASNLKSLEKRYARGLVDAFDLRLTRAQAATSKSAALARRQQMDASIRSLETLLGCYPSAELSTAAKLPSLKTPPAAGIPSELLARRPDILAQQNRLAAALSLEKSAKRNWLPSLSLTASDGSLSNSFSDLLDKDFNVWSLVGDASIALFQGGRLAAQREQLNANQLAQLASYKDLVLQAFREVETALKSETDLAELQEQTQISADENQQAETQAWQLYERGLIDITAALDAERRSFDARSRLLSIQNQRLQNRINLHIALGGDL